MANSPSTITLSRDALLPALALAQKAAERRSTIPIMSHLLLEVSAGWLTVAGSDLDRELRVDADVKGGDGCAFTLAAQHLHDAVRKLPAGAEIALSIDTVNATIVSGRSRFKLPVLPAADFPTMNAGELPHRFTLPADTVTAMLSTVGFAVSSEETRYYLCGVHLHADGDWLTAVATDGHRLARFRAALPDGAEGMPAIIVPRQTLPLLEALAEAKGDIEVSLSDTKIRFETAGRVLLSKLVDGAFPDYARVIPTGNDNRFSVDRAALAAAIDRVMTISPERGAALKCEFSAGRLALSAAHHDTGSAQDEVAAAGVGDDVAIGFNGRYCLDMLAATEAARMSFVLGQPGAPAIVEPEKGDDPKPLFVLMPMRIGS